MFVGNEHWDDANTILLAKISIFLALRVFYLFEAYDRNVMHR